MDDDLLKNDEIEMNDSVSDSSENSVSEGGEDFIAADLDLGLEDIQISPPISPKARVRDSPA